MNNNWIIRRKRVEKEKKSLVTCVIVLFGSHIACELNSGREKSKIKSTDQKDKRGVR